MSAAERRPVPDRQRDLVLSRVFDAPRERVFDAWTDPVQFREWWGPDGFTTPSCSIDLRPGGVIHFSMRSPDGHEFWSKGVYQEVVEPQRLVSLDSFSDADGNVVPATQYGFPAEWPDEALITVTFEDRGGRTKLTVRHGVPEDLAKKVHCDEGWLQSLDRLAQYLAR